MFVLLGYGSAQVMEVEITRHKDASEVTLKISVTADELAPYVRKSAEKLTKNKPLKGFRPGKAPIEVVEEAFGVERVMHEVIDTAVPHFYVEAVMDEEVEALAQPKVSVEKVSRTEGMKFTAIVAVLPQVTLGDLTKIAVEKRSVAVDDKALEAELKILAKMRSTYIDVARPAKAGDSVRVDFKISMNGTLLEGGESNDHPVHLGEGHFVPDFEQKLEGIRAGDEREFDITFPADYGKKEFAGKTAQAWVKAYAVQKRVLAELNDDFAKQVGEFTSLAELKKTLRENMVAEKEHKEQERRHADLAEQLAGGATFSTIPQVLIEKEIDHNLEELTSMLAMQQKTFEDYLAGVGKEAVTLRDEMRPAAKRRVKIGLALRAFSQQEKIEVSESEVEEKVVDYLQRFSTPEEAKKALDPKELKEQLTYMLKNQKVLEALEKQAVVKEVALEKKEIQKADGDTNQTAA